MNYKKGKHPKKASGKKIVLTIALSAAVLIVIGAVGARAWYQQQLKPLAAEDRYVVVDIESGSTPSQISNELQEKQVIRSSQAFMWYLRSSNLRDSLQAGRYQLNAADSVPEIANAITEGKVKKELFTILPGLRLDQIKANLIKAGYSEAEVETALNPSTYKNHPALVAKPASASLEGYLFPDSYQKTANTTAEQIVRQALDEMAEALTPEVIDGFQKQGLGIFHAITLASIVELEVSNKADRELVAGVFLNRLKIDMPLGADPTYKYAAAISGQAPSAFIDSPYNTRKYPGLPPGPISNVDKVALQAVANPNITDYLFFVAGDNGKTYFSKTQAEHEELARKHCIKLCSTF